MGRIDRARADFSAAEEVYTKARRAHDDAMDAWEARRDAEEG